MRDRRVRKILAGISAVFFFLVGLMIPASIFAFAALWLQAGIPILHALWWDQPALRSPLTVLLLVLVAGALVGGVAGAAYWVHFLRTEGLAREEDVWPFGRGQWRPTWELPRETLEYLQSTRRTRAIIGFIWLGLWALLGMALSPASLIPLSLWLVDGTPVLRSVWIRSSLPGGIPGDFSIVMIALFLGFLTGLPVTLFLLRRFLKRVLHFTDEEVDALFGSRQRR